jgi:hypothetical protein
VNQISRSHFARLAVITSTALGLVAASTPPVMADDAAAVNAFVAVGRPSVSMGPEGPITAVANAKGFKAAAQGGDNKLILDYTCEVLASGVVDRIQVTECSVRSNGPTNTPTYDNSPTTLPGNLAAQVASATLTGTTATACVQGTVYYNSGNSAPFGNCSPTLLAV